MAVSGKPNSHALGKENTKIQEMSGPLSLCTLQLLFFKDLCLWWYSLLATCFKAYLIHQMVYSEMLPLCLDRRIVGGACTSLHIGIIRNASHS